MEGAARSADELDDVERRMAECLEAPAEEQAARFERLCAERPELASEIARRLEALRAMGFLPAGADGAGGVDERELAGVYDAAPPERLGDFRLLGRLGAGGMGIVYRAEQVSLRREVALKLVRPELLFFPGARERFRREVEAVAGLKHPGIVPVYAVGQEGGLPFYAMELIEGRTLAQLLAQLGRRDPQSLTGADLAHALERLGVTPVPTPGSPFELPWHRAVLVIAREVADALEHAHSRGLVHRDVKPSNVALTARGRAMLLDFGLTSTAGPSGAAGAERVTRTGTQPGTPHYMAPEQLRADPVDARADVYALGVLLYELLALEPPFQGRNLEEIRARALSGDAPALRARNRAVPRDVAAIVRVAMDPARERRYGAAALLARDLDQALAGRPVVARPPGPALFAARWVRRHPTATVASLLGLLLLGGLPSVLYLQARGHGRTLGKALERERDALKGEQAARQDAEASLEFLFNMVQAAAPERLEGRPFDLEQWLETGMATVAELESRPAFLGRFLVFAGDAFRSAGNLDRAIEVLEQAREFERERGGAASDWSLRASSGLATVLEHRERLEEAEALFREVLAGWQVLYGERDVRLAATHNNLANVLLRGRRFEEAERELRRSLELYAAVEQDLPTMATVRGNLAKLLSETGRHDEAQAQAEQALAEMRSVPAPPADSLALLLNLIGVVRRNAGDLQGAEAALRESVSRFERIYPGPELYLTIACFNLADVLERSGRLEEAAELFGRAAGDMEVLGLTDHANAKTYRARLDAALAALERGD